MTKVNLAKALLFFLTAFATNLSAQEQVPAGSSSDVFREPFTVKFKFDKKVKVAQNFDKTPYVSEKKIHIFPGEQFGINLKTEGEHIAELTYQPELNKADVTFKFEVQQLGGHSAMVLTIKSNLDKMLIWEGWMLLPGNKELVRTSLAPVMPHLMGLETWPQAIAKLELRNLQLSEGPKGLARPPK